MVINPKEEVNKVKILCSHFGGGLGNRILGSVTAFYFARHFNTKLNIFWNSNSLACMANWDDLFEGNDNIGTCSDTELLPHLDHQQQHRTKLIWPKKGTFYFVHSPQWHSHREHVYAHRKMSRKQLFDIMKKIPQDTPVIIMDNEISKHVAEEEIKHFFKNVLQPKKFILEEVENFCSENNIDKNTVGCHLRMTDAPKLKLKAVSQQISSILSKRPKANFFVCSDSKETEEFLIKTYGEKIKVYPKKAYVTKYDESKPWEARGKCFPCNHNVIRGKEATIEGLIDCLILSKTAITIGRPGSSFFRLAKRFSIKWEENKK